MTEKLAAGFTAIVNAANAAALETAYPGLFANVGATAPFALHYSTGVGWKAVTIAV